MTRFDNGFSLAEKLFKTAYDLGADIGNSCIYPLKKVISNDEGVIVITLCDHKGDALRIGDTIRIFDWGKGQNLIGEAVLIWDKEEMCLQTEPMLVEDNYDLFNKAKLELVE